MPKTSAERQAAYRARRPLAGSNGERRLNMWVSTGTHLALERIATRDGVTQRQVLERLIGVEDDRILAAMEPDTPQWLAYFCIK